MSGKIRILVTDDSGETRSLIKQLISLCDSLELVGEASSGNEALEALKELQPDVVLMDINMPGLTGLEVTELISRLYPDIIVIIMSVQGETEYLRKAMISGAREYLIKPFSMELMEETIKNTFSMEKKRRQTHQVHHEQRDLESKSQISTFFSSKGGVGKSVVALNTAVMLSQSAKGKTVLVDLDLQFGDLGILSNLISAKTISDAADDNALEDPELLKGYLQRLGDLDVLVAPKSPEMGEYFTESHIQTLLQSLKKMYRHIVIDTAVNFSEINLGILDISDQIFIVSTMDLLSLKNSRLGLDVLRSLHHMDKVKLIVNRTNGYSGISEAAVEKILGGKPLAYLPEEERAMIESMNQGLPVAGNRKYRNIKFNKVLQKMISTWDLS